MGTEVKISQFFWSRLTQPTVPEGVEPPQAASTTLEDLKQQAQEKKWAAVYSFESNGSKIVVVDRAPIDHPLGNAGIPPIDGDYSRYAVYRVVGDGKVVPERPRQTIVAGFDTGEWFHQFGMQGDLVRFRFERKGNAVVLNDYTGAPPTLTPEYVRP